VVPESCKLTLGIVLVERERLIQPIAYVLARNAGLCDFAFAVIDSISAAFCLGQLIAHAIEELRDRFQFTEREFGGIAICGRFEPDVSGCKIIFFLCLSFLRIGNCGCG
jgi:hypothetical protein